MPEFSNAVVGIAKTLVYKRAAVEQGGLLSGDDPTAFNTADPLRLWIVQVGIIVFTTQILALGLRKIRQPKVIAEVLGGILLGPTAFGRIPGFTQHIFPEDSRPYLSLVANIGLCLFLFLVGLEIDAAVIKRNARLSITVALAGMVLPFGMGAGLSVPLYHRFIDPSIKFTNFMLFTGVAYSITAFPVLCRILTELKLLDTTVGVVVLSAGVGNDIIGWTLLALSVALVNAGSGLEALWILMVCVAWALVLLFPGKWTLAWLARCTGSIDNGPTTFFMTFTILLLFGSAFFTDIIGVHAIFGAFLTGIIVPREGGLAISLTEKLEDMVSIIFLPLYFTLSGLSTDLGLLNDGIKWGFTIAICALAYSGKFGGCTLAARAAGFSWREASTIGSLMSCKGLVELIVLNVGLSAGILNPPVFSMFVLEALLLTFMTTPAVTALYPPHKRVRVSATGANFANVEDGESGEEKSKQHRGAHGFSAEEDWKSRVTVVLDKIEHFSGMMSLTQMLRPCQTARLVDVTPLLASVADTSATKQPPLPHPHAVSVDALRLIELSDRTSAVMRSSVADTLVHTDPLLGIFRTFGDLNGMSVTSSYAIVAYDDLASSVAAHAKQNRSHLVIIPWLPPTYVPAPPVQNDAMPNPFEGLFKVSGGVDIASSANHSHFVRSVFSSSTTDVALFVDRHLPGEYINTAVGTRQHLLLPFFGGPDDRLALDFVVQLCTNANVSATVIRITRHETDLQPNSSIQKPQSAYLSANDRGDLTNPQHGLTIASAFPDTVYGNATTQTRLQSDTADNISWARYAAHTSSDPYDLFSTALSRVQFDELSTPTPLHSILEFANGLYNTTVERQSRLLIIAGRSRRLAVENHHSELRQLMNEHGGVGSEVKATVGDVATAFVMSGFKANVVVMQVANASLD